jgi:cytochrome P450
MIKIEIIKIINYISAPRGLLHSSYLGPVKIGPYTVPKGHGILAIFKSLLQGKEHWDRPDQFDPTRFLDENGKVSRDMHLIPFSIGKRVCPGETLARAEIFLFLVAILQVFKLEPEDPLNPPTLARKSGITSVPLPFGFKLITRTVRPFK